MTLSCGCDYDGDAAWYFEEVGFSTLKTKRGRRCRSCKTLLKLGAECLRLARWRGPRTDVEDRIHGDEVPLAPWYLCLPCADLMDALSAVNVCVDWTRPLADEVAEFNENYAPSGFRLKTKAALEEIKEGLFLDFPSKG